MKTFYTLLFALGCVISIYAQPNDNASDPPARDAGDVMGIYGDTYTAIAGINYDPDWGQSGHMQVDANFDPGTSQVILAYPNFNYQGTDFAGNPQDLSGMENLHVDIWVAAGTDRLVKISPIDVSGVGPGEVLIEVPLVPGSWNSVDIAKGDFTDMSWSSVIQIKFDGQFNSDGSANTDPFDIYLDNIYFWKEQTTSGTDATLSDLQVDGMTIPGFSPGVSDYTYGVEDGVMMVPEVTATTNDMDASAEITQASAIPGDATVVVTGGDGTTMQTYTVSFFYDSPADGAPDPTDLEENVISLFSDVYTDVEVDTWNTEWSDATFEDVMVNGNPTKKYTALGFNGIETVASPVDASSMMHINMDIWTPNMTEIKVKLVDFLGDGFAGPNGDTEAELTFPVTQNEWMKLSIPLEDFATAGMTAFSDLNQYIISSVPFGTGTLYVDNVYFSKMPTSSEDIELEQAVMVYPNPIRLGGTLFLSEAVQSVEIMSLNGQILRRANSNTVELNDMPLGTYLARITTLDSEKQITRIVIH